MAFGNGNSNVVPGPWIPILPTPLPPGDKMYTIPDVPPPYSYVGPQPGTQPATIQPPPAQPPVSGGSPAPTATPAAASPSIFTTLQTTTFLGIPLLYLLIGAGVYWFVIRKK